MNNNKNKISKKEIIDLTGKKILISSKDILTNLIESKNFLNHNFIVSDGVISKKDGGITIVSDLKDLIEYNDKLNLFEISNLENTKGLSFNENEVKKYANKFFFEKNEIIENPILESIFSKEILKDYLSLENSIQKFGLHLLNSKKRKSDVIGTSYFATHGIISITESIIPYIGNNVKIIYSFSDK